MTTTMVRARAETTEPAANSRVARRSGVFRPKTCERARVERLGDDDARREADAGPKGLESRPI